MGVVVMNVGKIPIFQRISHGGLKSREEKAERQQNRDAQIAVLEKQKAGLKNKECGSTEEIENKLELAHSYEDQIKAVKHAYNSEQMSHILDEAREKGEKIAEEIKKLTAKTKEEREKILREEALGIEESQGILSELMEELTEDVMEEASEELTGDVTEEVSEELMEDVTEEVSEELTGNVSEEASKELAERAAELKISS